MEHIIVKLNYIYWWVVGVHFNILSVVALDGQVKLNQYSDLYNVKASLLRFTSKKNKYLGTALKWTNFLISYRILPHLLRVMS